jgi:nucleoside-diphosphate-sugar epimerase
MKVVITGGAGFIGQRLASALLARGELTGRSGRPEAIERIVLADVARCDLADARIAHEVGDLADPAHVARILAGEPESVFHLAAVVSGHAEADFDVGMRVNLDATRALLEACRRFARPSRFVFSSSVAVFGGKLPDPVPEDWPLYPQTSYGTQKAVGELLVNDFSRKGFVDGRSLRLPTVSVRPGKPNRAASSFASGIVREPLAGVEAICPVPPEARMWLTSPDAVVENIIGAHEIDAAAFGHTRSLNLPGLTASVGEMAASLERVAGKEVAARIKWQRDEFITKLVLGWPAALETKRAHAMGLRSDPDFDTLVRAYMRETRPG